VANRLLRVALPTQACHSAFDWELLTALSAIHHFLYLLKGRQFCLLTELKLLVITWQACQQHQLAYTAEFTSDVKYLEFYMKLKRFF
jgi:hypothetical protein